MVRVNFEEVKLKWNRTIIIDGKKKKQTKTFCRTVNPFNTNPDGTVKTRAQVAEDNLREARAWAAQGAEIGATGEEPRR